MANEFQIIPAPDVELIRSPDGVATSYVRQNTLISILKTGIDTTEPYDNGQGVITIPAGGVVEYNGVLFRITNNVTLTKPNKNIAYWIAINDNGDGTANPVLVTRPGAWNPAKQGCYDSQNRRTLNWVSLGSLSGSPGTAILSENVKGTWEINLRKGWYYVELASGKGGGDGVDAIGGNIPVGKYPSAGGIPEKINIIKKPIFFPYNGALFCYIGGDGFNGGDGGIGRYGGGNGGGGGSGGGQKSFIMFGLSKKLNTGSVAGGIGGNGQGTSQYYIPDSGGGGGGGFVGGKGGIITDNAGPSGGDGGSYSSNGKNGQDNRYPGGSGGIGDYINNSSGGGGGGADISNRSNGTFGGGNGGIHSDGKRGQGQYSDDGVERYAGGGGGGGQGSNGSARPNGDMGGYCNIYPLNN